MSLSAGNSIVSLSVGLGVANTFTAWNAFVPDLREVREGATTDSALVGNVRHGEFATVVIAGGVAAGASAIVGSPLPLFVSAVLITGLIVLWEYTLNHYPFGPVSGQAGAS